MDMKFDMTMPLAIYQSVLHLLSSNFLYFSTESLELKSVFMKFSVGKTKQRTD